MATRCEKNEREEKFKAFWEFKAKSYPLPFDEKSLATTMRVIQIIKNRGVNFSGSKILDIGCGTGTYTLPLAREAALVIGLDSSKTMLTRLMDEKNRHGIENVDTVNAAWKDVDISVFKFNKGFDIVLTSMSMAVKDEEDLKKMEDCSKRWCVYIGWGSKRQNQLMEEVFAAHGLKYEPPRGAKQIYDILKKNGRKPSIDFIETSWSWRGTLDEAIEDVAKHIEVHGGFPRIDEIKSILTCHLIDGTIQHTTYVEEGIIVWEAI